MQMASRKGAKERVQCLISQGCGPSEIRRELGGGLKRQTGIDDARRLAIGSPSSSKSWKRIGLACRDRESDKRVSTQLEHEHMQPLRYFMDNRSRPLIKPNITSEGLSKLLREMN